jgi:membrane protein
MAATAQRRRASRTGLRGRLRQFVDRWVDLFDQHNLLTYASAIALQTVVAAVALVLLGLGLVHAAGREDLWEQHLAPQIEQRVLLSVYSGVNDTVERIFQSSSVGLIVFAVVVAVWEVSGGVRACMGALDQVYETEDDRPWWIRFPLSFGLSVCLIVALIGAILLIVVAGGAVHGGWVVPYAIARWLGAIVLLSAAFSLLVRWGPAERRGKKWATVGGTLVVIAWIVESIVFKWYVTSLANFKTAPGSLFVVLVATSYFYVGAIILLVGIELDELLRKDAPEHERAIHQHIAELVRTVRRRS